MTDTFVQEMIKLMLVASNLTDETSDVQADQPQAGPSAVLLSEIPRVYHLNGFLEPAYCDALIQAARDKIAPSTTVDPETGEFIKVESRTSSGTFFSRGETPLITEIEARLSALVQMPVENGEGLQVLRYAVGQEYQPHHDYFDPALKGAAKPLADGGQRVATVLLYLNDVEAGGETIFPEVNIAVKPRKGDAVLFYNCFSDGSLDPASLHGSIPVEIGEKWVATKWVREREYGSAT